MSKELEALKTMGSATVEEDNCVKDIYYEEYDIVKQALQRLEQIDNASPSKTLELLKETKKRYFNLEYGHTQQYIDHWKNLVKTLDVIEKTLLKAQEQEKVLKIIKEHLTFKDSGIEEYTDVLTNQKVKKHCIKIESKDTGATIHIHLDTQEEFDTLKRYCDEH